MGDAASQCLSSPPGTNAGLGSVRRLTPEAAGPVGIAGTTSSHGRQRAFNAAYQTPPCKLGSFGGLHGTAVAFLASGSSDLALDQMPRGMQQPMCPMQAACISNNATRAPPSPPPPASSRASGPARPGVCSTCPLPEEVRLLNGEN